VNQTPDKKSSVTEQKKQQILVPHDFSDACNCAVQYGVMLSSIFRCELSLLHVVTPAFLRQNASAADAGRDKLARLAVFIEKQSGIKTNAYVIQGKLSHLIPRTATYINAITIVAGLNSVNREGTHYFTAGNLVRKYRELRMPLLIVHNKVPDVQAFSHIILPVDFTRESKEKAAWAGYFGKLNQTRVTIVHTEHKDGFFSAQVRNNLLLIKKLFDSLKTDFDIHKAEKVRYGIDRYALSYAKMRNAGMMIIMARKEWGFDDFFLGPPEQRIITNEDQLPVMLINPRDDLYVPCV
jgi:hypothetical protein